MSYFLGIDLGTTQTKATVGWFENEKLILRRLPLWQSLNPFGTIGPKDILPSVLWLKDNQVKIGEQCDKNAHNLVAGYPGSHLVRSIKREMGNNVWSVESGGFPYRPHHLAALLLISVRRSFERVYPGKIPSRITITIPASYSSSMRKATLAAAALAGFPIESVQLIDEPLAAFFSSFLSVDVPELNKPIVVFDMGGGTLDASVIKRVDINEFELMATSRYNEIAGDDLTLEIGALILREARLQKNISFGTLHLPGFGLGLWNLAEAMKTILRECLERNMNYGTYDEQIEMHYRAGDFISTEQCLRLEGLPPINIYVCDILKSVKPFFDLDDFRDTCSRSIRRPIYQSLSFAQVEAYDITRVYTTGGSSAFPPVLSTLNQVFRSGIIKLDPYHAVADGALYWTAMSSIGKLNVTEKIFENLYLRLEGQGFIEILRAPISIPEQNETVNICGSIEFQPDKQPVIEVRGRGLTVEFFRGESVDDPLMTAAHYEFIRLERAADGEVKLEKVTSQVNADKIFKCELILRDKKGILQAQVELHESNSSQDADTSRLPTNIVLNGERL